MGTPELNLDFTPSFTEVVNSHPLSIGFGNDRELTSRNGLDDNCQYIGNVGSNPLRLPTAMLLKSELSLIAIMLLF